MILKSRVALSFVRQTALQKAQETLTFPQRKDRQLWFSARVLLSARKWLRTANATPKTVIDAMTKCISAEPLAKIDYVSAVDALSITPIETYSGYVLTAIAVISARQDLLTTLLLTSTHCKRVFRKGEGYDSYNA